MKNSEPKHISDVIQSFFKTRHWTQRMDGYNIFDLWGDILPQNIALNTKPVKIQNNILFLIVKNHVWASEINIRKGEILNLLNQKIGQDLIENIIIRIKPNKFINNK